MVMNAKVRRLKYADSRPILCTIFHYYQSLTGMMDVLFINSTDLEIQTDFHAPSLPISTDPPFCRYELVTTAYLNYEARTSYTFSVVATDSAGLSSSASVTVDVLPVNEFPPSFTVKK